MARGKCTYSQNASSFFLNVGDSESLRVVMLFIVHAQTNNTQKIL